MKGLVILLALVVAATAFQEHEYQFLFSKWMQQHEKAYPTAEFFARYNTWKKNLDYVNAFNNEPGHTYWLEMNMFADLTEEEFGMRLGFKPVELDGEVKEYTETAGAEIPNGDIDWVSKGAVTSVKNQGQCGSCWTFATAAALESIYKIKRGSLIDFSEQQILDCCKDYGCGGGSCNGGNFDVAYNWLKKVSICKLSDYTYKAVAGSCKSCPGVVKTTGYVKPTGEAALYNAISQQPVAVAVCATKWSLYGGGIYQDTSCGTSLNHAVTLVGAGTSGSTSYWRIKNSWGTGWGEQGYIRLGRGRGYCGIGNWDTYPTI